MLVVLLRSTEVSCTLVPAEVHSLVQPPPEVPPEVHSLVQPPPEVHTLVQPPPEVCPCGEQKTASANSNE